MLFHNKYSTNNNFKILAKRTMTYFMTSKHKLKENMKGEGEKLRQKGGIYRNVS